MTMLQGLVRYYERLENTGLVAPPGYSTEKISFAVVLAPEGRVIGVDDLRDHSGKKPQPASKMVPQAVKRTSGVASNFLWDKTAYVFGRSATSKRLADEHAAFCDLHQKLLASTDDDALRALLLFLNDWNPAQFAGLRYAEEMLDQNIVFRLDGELSFLHDHEAAKRIWAEHLASGPCEKRLCLVTGEESVIARIHPAIKGVPGAQTSGASIVSFNLDAFTSFGKEQGENAPVSERAAHAYGTALNALLSLKEGIDPKTNRPRWRNRVQIGDATTVFWAEAEGGPEAAEAAEVVFSWILDPSTPTDEEEAARVQSVLYKIEKGRPVEEIDELDRQLAPETRFYVLGLSPNAARLSVRFWLVDTFQHFVERLGAHYRDLAIAPKPRGWGEAPSIQRLLVRTTALQEKFENIPPLLAGEVMRAVLTGMPYPRTLLTAAIMRLRAGDSPGSGWHAALIKACLNRFATNEEEKLSVALDTNNPSPAYQLGRLFAVLESAQYAALGRVNAPIGDRYYGAASATPARVFGPLLRGLQNHISDARKRGRGGWIEPKVAEIISKLPPELPRTLRLEDQGRFAVGYYHERATRFDQADETVEKGGE